MHNLKQKALRSAYARLLGELFVGFGIALVFIAIYVHGMFRGQTFAQLDSQVLVVICLVVPLAHFLLMMFLLSTLNRRLSQDFSLLLRSSDLLLRIVVTDYDVESADANRCLRKHNAATSMEARLVNSIRCFRPLVTAAAQQAGVSRLSTSGVAIVAAVVWTALCKLPGLFATPDPVFFPLFFLAILSHFSLTFEGAARDQFALALIAALEPSR
jgi:hypothetical protein